MSDWDMISAFILMVVAINLICAAAMNNDPND